MIPFLLALITPDPAPLAWVDQLLRQAPPSAPAEFPPSSSVESTRPPGTPQIAVRPPDEGHNRRPIFDPSVARAEREAEHRYGKKVTGLLAAGRYEDAYRLADSHRRSDDDFVGGWFVDASLLTGRYDELEGRLVGYLRRHPEVEGHQHHSGSTYLALSLASAMRGHVWAGQGRYVVDAFRQGLRYDTGYEAAGATLSLPSTPAQMTFASVVALAETSGVTEDAYWKWALRLDPKCVLAAEKLVDHCEAGKDDAEIARLSASMVRNLPSGSKRDQFAHWMRDAQARMAAAKAGPSDRR